MQGPALFRGSWPGKCYWIENAPTRRVVPKMSSGNGNGQVQDTLAVFRSSQGVEMRGNLLRFTRYLVVFEIYNPGGILQSSEVLSDFKIIWNDRTLYSGRAVVKEVMNTGLVTVCEATLGESWLDIDFMISSGTTDQLGAQFQTFMAEWQKLYRVTPEYKVVIADLQTFLSDVRIWLEQVELAIRGSPAGDRIELEKAVVRDLERFVVPPINSLFERFETVAQKVEDELQPAHRAFGKRQLHPLLLSSPFVYRTFHKPLGYAGDYEVVNMMFRDPYEGASLFAKMVNAYALQLPPIRAHRNRIDYLLGCLTEETRRVANLNRTARIFNLGCGPAQEVQRFLANQPISDRASFTLADFNEETLAFTSRQLNDLKNRYGRQTQVQLIKRSVQQLLKQADRTVYSSPADQYDLVYCAGLFDYLSDKVCRKLLDIFYDMLAPGGRLLVTNVDVHPSRGEMECFLEWHLVHRNTQQMSALAPARVSADEVSLVRDPTGVNIIMSVRKANGGR